MSKMKRNVGPKAAKPVTTIDDGWFGPFLEDWGRLVVPAGFAAIVVLLRLLDVIDDTGSGLMIGMVLLAALFVACILIVWRNDFPSWVRGATVGLGLLMLGGMVVPLVDTVYPGLVSGGPVFQTTVSKEKPEAPVTGNLGSGWYSIEVFAQSMFEAGTLKGEGQYKVMVGSAEVSGRFSDTMRAVRATRRGGTRQVEQKHLMEVHTVDFAEAPTQVKAIRVDQAIGPELKVSVFPMIIPPPLIYILVSLAMALALLLDGLFQEQTEKWRLTEFVGTGLAFLLIFHSAYERGNVTSAAVWSIIFGGVAGFLGGWLLSLIGRKVIGKVRTRV